VSGVEPVRPVEPGAPADPWAELRRHTPARIGLGRTGDAVPTSAVLRFEAAHALARDAVHDVLDADRLAADLAGALGGRLPSVPPVLDSAAPDRAVYLQRPDLGRRLAPSARTVLQARPGAATTCDLVLVLADGLSARAVAAHAVPTAAAVLERLPGWSVTAVVVRQGRVAVGDEVGLLLGARFAVVLLGERPGLSAPDSLGAYLTRDPRPGRRDSERNCVSNIRPPDGQGIEDAAATIAGLLLAADRLGVTGVRLKDDLTLPS